MAFVLTRALTVHGRPYRAGETLETATVDRDKLQQLIALRVVTDTSVSAPGRCVALRTLRVGETVYQRGDRVDVRGVAPGKIAQLLEHRMLDLAPSHAS